MILIISSFILGIIGFVLGSGLGEEFSFYFCIIGILSPALFTLEQIYKLNKQNNQTDINYYSVLEKLKSNGILTDTEYEKAYSKLDEDKTNTENKIEYDKGVHVIYELSKESIISEEEFHKKIWLLKSLFNQK